MMHLPLCISATSDLHDLRIHDPSTLQFAIIMSLPPHGSHLARISCDPMALSPAPVHEGQSHGYFEDEATHLLLGLGATVVPLNSGACGGGGGPE